MLEVHGFYKDYEYAVYLVEERGFRCGYVVVPETHPYYNISNPPIDCHGGITFAEFNTIKGTEGEKFWIGFDCNHTYDGIDIEAIKKYYGSESNYEYQYTINFYDQLNRLNYPFLDCEDCVNECKHIIRQLISSMEK